MIGLFLKGVICIDFAHFCRGIYNSTEGVPNQDAFVIDVFKAAGSSYSFTKKGAYSNSNYGVKLFNGGKLLSRNHRSSFPNPINTTGLAKYLSEHIKSVRQNRDELLHDPNGRRYKCFGFDKSPR